MKKKIIRFIVILITVSVIGVCFWVHKEKQENIRIDAEAITLKEDLTVKYGDKVKISDFIENIKGKLINDKEINTEELGDIQVSFDFINIKN